MIKKPIISVLMPVYNGSKYICCAIESILAQTFPYFEFIIINDGSTDNSEDIILSYKDIRIKYIKNNTNLGLIKTLNRGIKIACGEYIARMDADDISLPTRLEKQHSVFKTYRSVDIVNIPVYLLDEDGNSFRKHRTYIDVNFEAIQHIIIFENPISHPGVMIKSKILKEYKYRDIESVIHIEDFDLWNRLFKDGYVCYSLEESLILYRNNSQGISNTQSTVQQNRVFKLTDSLLKERYNFNINKDVLSLIVGDLGLCNYKLLIQTNKTLESFINKIKIEKTLSTHAYEDLRSWKLHFTFSLAIKSLIHVKFNNKFGVSIFLLSRFFYLKNKKWRVKIKEIIFEKRFQYNFPNHVIDKK